MLFEIRAFFVIASSLYSSYTDFKSGYIYDYITYPLIAAGIILSFFDKTYYISTLTATLTFLIGYLFYRYGKFGGGDVKLLTGISACIPLYYNIPFVLVVLFTSSVVALLFYGTKNLYIIYKNNLMGRLEVYFIAFIALFLMIFLTLLGYSYVTSLILLIMTLILVINAYYRESIENILYVKKIKVSELLDDDIVDLTKIGYYKNTPLDPELLKVVKQKLDGNELVDVYRNLPIFGPFIFAGILISLYLIPTILFI